ncbi:MAG TPA: molybdenum ABC transporter ATP-binding protein [Pseudomonadales bacterium]|nr:molybdenum ABC transporter ATP-binding protein [Pseudomonadales bacterium]
MNDIHADFSLSYGDFSLAAQFNLPGKGISALFGHSGSGKTTCLRIIAGLEQRAYGFLSVNGEVWQDSHAGIFKPTHQREIGYVFQEASLFAHLNVQKNLEFGMPGRSKPERMKKIQSIGERLGISHLLQREPTNLSGGERQRIAIARALLTEPKLLLFDEPLTALDQKRKTEILPYLERLHEELDMPMIYVSHAAEEVAQLADHLVLLNEGKVIASGSLQETLTRLDLPGIFTDEAAVVIETTVGAHEADDHLSRLDFPGGYIFVSHQKRPLNSKVRCRILARDVSLAIERHTDTSILNAVKVEVVEMAETENPAHMLVKLKADGTLLLSRITKRSKTHLRLETGVTLWAQIKAVALLN